MKNDVITIDVSEHIIVEGTENSKESDEIENTVEETTQSDNNNTSDIIIVSVFLSIALISLILFLIFLSIGLIEATTLTPVKIIESTPQIIPETAPEEFAIAVPVSPFID